MNATKSQLSKKAKKTTSSRRVFSEDNGNILESWATAQLKLMKAMVFWGRGHHATSHLPPSAYLRQIANPLAKRLESLLLRCAAEHRTLIAAEVLYRIFERCIPAAKKKATLKLSK
jgi:hypothetical protein